MGEFTVEELIVLEWLVENVEWPDDGDVLNIWADSDGEIRFSGNGVDFDFYPETFPEVISEVNDRIDSSTFTKEQFLRVQANQRQKPTNGGNLSQIPEPEFGQVFHIDGTPFIFIGVDYDEDYIFRDSDDNAHYISDMTELDEYTKSEDDLLKERIRDRWHECDFESLHTVDGRELMEFVMMNIKEEL